MNIRSKIIFLVAVHCLLCFLDAMAQVSFSGTDFKVLSEKPDAGSGLDQVYVIYSAEGVTAKYKAASDATVQWSRFSNLGGGYAEEIAAVHDGRNTSVTLTAQDMGYIIDEGTKRTCFWMVNYSNHMAEFDALDISPEQECDRARLTFHGKADKITYYTVNGAARTLSRELLIEYKTLKYDEAADMFIQIDATQTFASIDESVGVFAPLCDTSFLLSGDKFLRAWGLSETLESPYYQAIAIEARTSATQTPREVENEQKVEANLGGSAPVEVAFHAVVSDAAIFREWQLARDPQFDEVEDRYQQLDFEYTFRDNGNYYVRFIANNSAGSCECESETYEVFIGESSLLCPNTFSPNGDGVNDEWRVSYRSIVQYECHIFNRWGQELFSSTNPAQGWDGRHNGKYVPTGVYYYVVNARGSEGRKYRLRGDINIIHSQGHKDGSSASDL